MTGMEHGHHVAVGVSTLWIGPDSPREIDALAVADDPDIAGWLALLDRGDARLGLHGRVLSQLVRGEAVDVVGSGADGWVEVVCPWQPSSRDPRGYPGWLRAAHLRPGAPGIAAAVARGATADGPALVRRARRHLGLPYLWGGLCEQGLDCSGLVHLALRRLGVTVPRDAHDQQRACTPVPLDEVEPGDLFFFGRDGAPIHHVGIVTSAETMLHAPETGARIVDEPLTTERRQTLVAAGRPPFPGSAASPPAP